MFTGTSKFSLAVCVTVALSAPAHGQDTCSTTGAGTITCTPAGMTTTVTVLRVVYMSVAPASAALTAPSNTDFTAGGTTTKTDVGAHVITVKANATWAMTIKGATWTGTGNTGKAISDISWSTTGGAPWTTMTNAAVALSSGGVTAGTTVTLSYETAWALITDSPGTYTMPLTFTLTAP